MKKKDPPNIRQQIPQTRVRIVLQQRDQRLAKSISNPSPPSNEEETHLGHRRTTLILPRPLAILRCRQ